MSQPLGYRYVLDETVAEEILGFSHRRRAEFIRYFRELASDPFQRGEMAFSDSETGITIEKKRFGQWRISFWSDHAVKEVRILGVQKVAAGT